MPDIVVDVGCKTIGTESSIPELLARFQPRILFGFDPNLGLEEGVFWGGVAAMVVTRRAAAWTHTGTVPFHDEGTRSRIVNPVDADRTVPCIDLAAFLLALPKEAGIVVKLDIEGGEYALLRALIDHLADVRCSLILVEWHDDPDGTKREPLIRALGCPVEDWQ